MEGQYWRERDGKFFEVWWDPVVEKEDWTNKPNLPFKYQRLIADNILAKDILFRFEKLENWIIPQNVREEWSKITEGKNVELCS